MDIDITSVKDAVTTVVTNATLAAGSFSSADADALRQVLVEQKALHQMRAEIDLRLASVKTKIEALQP